VSVVLQLTGAKYGDPVLVCWDKVTLVSEVRKEQDDVRTFLHSLVHFGEGGLSSIAVKESIPEILDLLKPPKFPAASWVEP
jgi:hypothetical protein